MLKNLLLATALLLAGCAGSGDVPPGVVIAHYPQKSGLYVGSPSLCILPDGSYVASHDEFGPSSGYLTGAFSQVYRSEDRGESWTPVARLEGQLWSNLFWHRGALYLMGTDKEHGNLLIRRSDDGGRSWTTPSGSASGLIRVGQYHTAPMPMLYHNGRIWRGVENAASPIEIWGKRYSAMLVSAPEEADLLRSESWTETECLRYDSTYLDGKFGGWLEGNALLTPEGQLVDMLRVDYAPGPEYAALVQVDEATGKLSFDPAKDFVKMPGGAKKFTVRYDSISDRYLSLVNYVKPAFDTLNPAWVRNTQALASSPDLRHWTVHAILLEHPEQQKHGFQYVDWLFDGEDIAYLSRTAYDDASEGAHNNHDANYLTFHRIKNFRDLLSQEVAE